MNKSRIYEDIDLPLLSEDGKRWIFGNKSIPVVRGAATASPVYHPLAAPTISGDTISVDTMLQQPTRITAFLMDLTLQRFVLDRLFTSAGGVSGGAVVYDEATENELYLDRDVQRVAPGGEFPIVTSQRRAPRVAEVEKWGGKFPFTDEAKDRNDAVLFRNETVKLGNTIVRKLNQRAIEILEVAIAGTGGASTFVGQDWSAFVPAGAAPSAPAASPHADFAKAQLLADQREIGVNFDTLLVSPVNANELHLGYGANLDAVLEDNGIEEMYVSNRIATGTAYIVASGELGEMRVEQPLATETAREGAPSLAQRTWVQSSVRPVMFVRNPYAVMKVTGI